MIKSLRLNVGNFGLLGDDFNLCSTGLDKLLLINIRGLIGETRHLDLYLVTFVLAEVFKLIHKTVTKFGVVHLKVTVTDIDLVLDKLIAAVIEEDGVALFLIFTEIVLAG